MTVICDVETVADGVAASTDCRIVATWSARNDSPLAPAMAKVLLSSWQAVVFTPQTKVFVLPSLEHGVRPMTLLGLSA